MKYNEIVKNNFKNWFGDSKVVDSHGNPMVMYHGTAADFETFHPWSHFGTSIAANDRLGFKYKKEQENLKLFPVYLKIEKPLLITDQESGDEASLFNSLLRIVNYKKIFSPEYIKNFSYDIKRMEKRIKQYRLDEIDFDFARKNGIVSALEQIGYDGLVYSNDMEDAGKNSWVIFNPNQVRSIFQTSI